MVNIQPIPPLLCSTPPPIDFGEEDEDVDVLQPSLVDMEDVVFGDFLTEDDIKSNEPLPSPRSPSVCDLPSISIYDGFISHDEENITNHIRTSPCPPTDNQRNKDSENCTKSSLTEAFNFNVRNTNNNETKNICEKEVESPTIDSDTHISTEGLTKVENERKTSGIFDTQSNRCPRISKNVCSGDAIDLEATCLKVGNKLKHISSIQNSVSIEDIADDFSDDELYSPKSPKNFLEEENCNNYFKIEEIKPVKNIAGNERQFDSKDVYSKHLDTLTNNETASLGNEKNNELKSLSCNLFVQNKLEIPPSLREESNSTDYDDDADDFGDFADFHETHFINNTVPVTDINIEQNNGTELNTEVYTHITKVHADNIHEAKDQELLKASESLSKEIHDLKSNDAAASNKLQATPNITPNVNSLNLQTISQELSSPAETGNRQSFKEFCHNNNSSDGVIAALEIYEDKEDFGNFAEFPNSPEEENSQNSPNGDDDEFDDFADFESHKEVKKLDSKTLSPVTDENHVEENDDDDFGDFNTADPITGTVSNITVNKTSQNTAAGSIPAIPSYNLNERISKILQLMFSPPIDIAKNPSDEPKPNKIQDIPFTSIDAAKALEYQWLISDTRHAFIRSLGIDSKNILFGDNWNPSLPRFAANLSFNPLKPMKPVQSSSSPGDASSLLEPIPITSSVTIQALEISSNTQKETLHLDWKSSTEQNNDAFEDNNFIPVSTAMPFITNEPPPTEPESLTIFENPVEDDDKLSKTPPISEMESVTAFPSVVPTPAIDIKLPTTSVDLEENLKNTLNINEVVVTSTFTGSIKETHIYTPPQSNDFESKHDNVALPTSVPSPTKVSPIDFDYEKAAMGVIIDETVVKKEYRDVEYNPPFTMDSLNKSASSKIDIFEPKSYANANANILTSTDVNTVDEEGDDSCDDFSEFQSVSSDVAMPETTTTPKSIKPSELSRTTAISHGGMILSPAILIPQAIYMENQKPKIEWGVAAASINPEELARIEELFPEPKLLKSCNGSSSSQKSTPTHQMASTPSISATVANKELECNVDDEDWSDFISVNVTNNTSANKTGSNNNSFAKSPAGSPFPQRSPLIHRIAASAVSNSNNDDEWSEFVSSAPPTNSNQHPTSYRVPQFNSGAWQNANFYNNPLSMYHKGPLDIPTASATTPPTQKYSYNNNNNNYNISQQPYQIANNSPPVMLSNKQQTPNNAYQQQIHVMQNFSTAPVPTPERLSTSVSVAKNNQFQSIGSAKVAPSIALIPDLGFVAPAIPTHTSFINSLPKPSINMKK